MPPEKRHDEAKLRHLLGYISLVRDELRMQNWDIILHHTVEDDEDTHAHTWQENNHTTLNIGLGPTFFEESPAIVRNTIVHELIHAQHRDVSRLWDECTKGNADVPISQSESWDGDFRVFMERFVSWITKRITPTVSDFVPSKKYKVTEGCFLAGEQDA